MPPVLSTLPGPALYAARASLRSPLYFSSNCWRNVAPAPMFWCGSNGSSTLNCSMVAGISCISPLAPFGETAQAWNPDSCSITPRSSLVSTWCCCAARSISGVSSTSATGSQSAAGASIPGDIACECACHCTAISLCLRTASRCIAMAARCFAIADWNVSAGLAAAGALAAPGGAAGVLSALGGVAGVLSALGGVVGVLSMVWAVAGALSELGGGAEVLSVVWAIAEVLSADWDGDGALSRPGGVGAVWARAAPANRIQRKHVT